MCRRAHGYEGCGLKASKDMSALHNWHSEEEAQKGHCCSDMGKRRERQTLKVSARYALHNSGRCRNSIHSATKEKTANIQGKRKGLARESKKSETKEHEVTYT